MTVNLLSQKLKAAKKEITDLKTAHKRGFGNLKIYRQKQIIDVSGHPTGTYYILSVNVNFSSSFSAYPFVSIIPNAENYAQNIILQRYFNNGYSITQEFLWNTNSSLNSHFVEIFSISPITSVSYNWRNL
ncbi:MAG: hypothetical protein J6Z11_12365 [Candidatus Riflebacteria bacterium]|nr:hypothetical protein [Candidatus Riflebacteria bacterium]